MKWSLLILPLVVTLFTLFGYIILNLNDDIILVDIFFNEIEISLGLILLVFFLFGLFSAIFFEVIYFLGKRRKGHE